MGERLACSSIAGSLMSVATIRFKPHNAVPKSARYAPVHSKEFCKYVRPDGERCGMRSIADRGSINQLSITSSIAFPSTIELLERVHRLRPSSYLPSTGLVGSSKTSSRTSSFKTSSKTSSRSSLTFQGHEVSSFPSRLGVGERRDLFDVERVGNNTYIFTALQAADAKTGEVLAPGRIRDSDTVWQAIQRLNDAYPKQVPLLCAAAVAFSSKPPTRPVRVVIVCRGRPLDPAEPIGVQCMENMFTNHFQPAVERISRLELGVRATPTKATTKAAVPLPRMV